MSTWVKRLAVIFVGLFLIFGAGAWYFGRSASAGTLQFRTTKVTRGDVVAAISATGTVEPTESIDVGSQVTGQIQSFGNAAASFKKPSTQPTRVDYTSNVKEGDLLAQIDPTTYEASVLEAKAQLAQAQAGVKRAEADQVTARAKLDQAQRDWERAQKIGAGDALAQTQFDTYKSTFEQAQAAVGVADAALVSAQASVDQAGSTVKRAQTNVRYCTITSPIDGTIIDRRVNIGQTVVSSMSASSLFLIARDLHHLQIWVAVNEADYSHIYPGQPVTFTVDALGDRPFTGTVDKMRLNAQMTQNVVVYTVEVKTENPDLTLIPYLTANVQFETERQNDALLIPNGAPRWQPTPELIVPSERDKYAGMTATPPAGGADGAKAGPAAGPPAGHGNGGKGKKKENGGKPATVWVKDGAFVRPVAVTAGVTDGATTAVVADDLKEDDEVVTGTTMAAAGDTNTGPTNPFLPQMRRPGGGGGGGGGGPRR